MNTTTPSAEHSANDVYVTFLSGQQQWAVCGANLPAGSCWSLHDDSSQAQDEAVALADDFGVRFVGTLR